jgi:anti-sigma-K factor RskA
MSGPPDRDGNGQNGNGHGPGEDMQVLAGEYVLGVLDAAEMRAVRQREARDPALAEAIQAWERRLAPLADTVPPEPPPPALWNRLEAAVAALPLEDEPPLRTTVPAPVLRAPAERLVPGMQPGARGGQRRGRRVWPWQLATGASLALAAGIAAFAWVNRPQPGPVEVAELLPSNAGYPGFVARTEPNGRVMLIAPAAAAPTGRDYELWILPKGEAAPRSLGVLPAGGRQIELANRPTPGTQIMVSVEQPGGSPTGKPSDEVVFAGTLDRLAI